MSYRETLIWRMTELGRSAFESFENDKLASAILLTRATVETSAALWYLCGKIDAALKAATVGDIDDYLMKLIMGSKTNPGMPPPINVLTFVDRVEKDIPGFRHQYDLLSEFSHPHWAGAAGLYSRVDLANFWTNVGPRTGDNDAPKRVGVLNLSVGVEMFESSYNRLIGLMPAFIALCEDDLKTRGTRDEGKA